MDFVSRVQAARPAKGQATLFWLGQAGFLIKTASGRLICIDPYFSDSVMHAFPEMGLGFKRLAPPPCAAGDLVFDELLISHEHGDHFDTESVEAMLASGRTHVYANAPVARELAARGYGADRVTTLKKGETVRLAECALTPTDCDHGELAPEALGFLLDFGFTRLYYAGDTALTLDRLREPIRLKPEAAILPINGAFGNLDGAQAAEYAGLLGCKTCVPCHFWTFPLHHGDPQQIIDAMPEKAPGCKLALLCQGESIDL